MHKFQGQTIAKPTTLVGHMETLFSSGQAYVLLGRVQSLGQIYLTSCEEKIIKTNKAALGEADRLSTSATNLKPSNWQQTLAACIKIVAFNIRSLQKHISDIQNNNILLKSDFLCISETWLRANNREKDLEIPGFKVHFCGSGIGKGVALYVREKIMPNYRTLINSESYQILQLTFADMDVTVVYRSPKSSCYAELTEDLSKLSHGGSLSVICGDFNIDLAANPNNELTGMLLSRGFQQVVKQPTHIGGGILDHIYINKGAEEHFLYPLHFSDHDATCVILNRVQKA